MPNTSWTAFAKIILIFGDSAVVLIIEALKSIYTGMHIIQYFESICIVLTAWKSRVYKKKTQVHAHVDFILYYAVELFNRLNQFLML